MPETIRRDFSIEWPPTQSETLLSRMGARIEIAGDRSRDSIGERVNDRSLFTDDIEFLLEGRECPGKHVTASTRFTLDSSLIRDDDAAWVM